MKWNREEVSRLLNGRITDEPSAGAGDLAIVRFEDARLRFELFIHESGVFLAADPELPLQGLPSFEIALSCTDLAPVQRIGMPTGVGIYAGPSSPTTLRFSITRREDGAISLSGACAGLTAPNGAPFSSKETAA